MTPYEQKLWQRLRRKQLFGLKFRRQHPVGRFILDFFCAQCKLAVELDGATHDDPSQRTYDDARTAWLTQQGIRVVRFSNQELERNIEGVLLEIAGLCGVLEDSRSLD